MQIDDEQLSAGWSLFIRQLAMRSASRRTDSTSFVVSTAFNPPPKTQPYAGQQDAWEEKEPATGDVSMLG